MPVRLDGRVVAAINLTWRRQVLSLTGMVQRHLQDLQAAVRAVEERTGEAGFDRG
jgi:IclR family transcriptional regulator, mhp operon transcriptional activator